MVVREGKFGKFWACTLSNPTDNHGTITISLKVSKPEPYRASILRDYAEGIHPVYPMNYLETVVKRQCVALGAPMDDLGQLCEWIVDSEADTDEYGEESGSWRNVRPY